MPAPVLEEFEAAVLTGDLETALERWRLVKALSRSRPAAKRPLKPLDHDHPMDMEPEEHTRHIRFHEREYRQLKAQLAHETDPEVQQAILEHMQRCVGHWHEHRKAKHCPKPKGKDCLVKPGDVERTPDPAALIGKKPAAGPAKPAAKPAPVQKAVEGKPPRKFSVCLFSLSEDAADLLRSWAYEHIPDADLAADGREKEPHITVRYGLHTDNGERVGDVLTHRKPVTVRVGNVSIFPGEEYDVVKLSVESSELHALHRQLAELEHTDTFPDYKPHITLAYVKPGAGAKYDGLKTPLSGEPLTFDTLVFSNQDRQTFPIRLGEPLQKAVDGGTVAAGSVEAITRFLEELCRQGVRQAEGRDLATGSKTRVLFQGIPLHIENPRGSTRRGTGPNGDWETTMAYPYGEIEGTVGMDGDPVDVFLGPERDAPFAYVITQHAIEKVQAWPGGCCPQCGEIPQDCPHDLDEEKVMLGFLSETEAVQAYCVGYDEPDRFLGPVATVPVETLLDYLRRSVQKSIPIPSIEKAGAMLGNRGIEKSEPSGEPGEGCPHCGALHERGDDGRCNRCGKPWVEGVEKAGATLGSRVAPPTPDPVLKALAHEKHPFLKPHPSGMLHLTTPYHKNFIKMFKEYVPQHARHWDKENKRWEVHPDYHGDTLKLLHQHFDASKHPRGAGGKFVPTGDHTPPKHPLHDAVVGALTHLHEQDAWSFKDQKFGQSLVKQSAGKQLTWKQIEAGHKLLGSYKEHLEPDHHDSLWGAGAQAALASHAEAQAAGATDTEPSTPNTESSTPNAQAAAPPSPPTEPLGPQGAAYLASLASPATVALYGGADILATVLQKNAYAGFLQGLQTLDELDGDWSEQKQSMHEILKLLEQHGATAAAKDAAAPVQKAVDVIFA